jgi:RNA polymerase sigma-70 factor, ECF subfamily
VPILQIAMQATWAESTFHESEDDAELLKLAKQRDSAAWSTLYSLHYDSVYRYLFGRIGSREEAEDIASQVFLEALRSIDSYSDMGKPFAAWLFGIARNLANNLFRNVSRRGELAGLIEEQEAEDGKATFGDLKAEMLDLIAGINQLTKDQRETVVLRFYVGLSAKEVAAVLGKTEPAIYALQVRAVSALRRILHEDQDQERAVA